MMAAVRLPARRLPAKSQFLRPRVSFPRFGRALYVVNFANLLQLLLYLVEDLLLNFLSRGARPVGPDDHCLERELGVLFLTQVFIGK